MYVVKVVVKSMKLMDKLESDQRISIRGYSIVEEKWEIRDIENTQISRQDLIKKLIEIAAEYNIKERGLNYFLLTEVESPGLRVLLGDDKGSDRPMYITLKPSYLRRISFVKCIDINQCNVVYEFKPSSQTIVYDGYIDRDNVEFDFAVIECDDHVRILFPHELISPRLKQRSVEKKKRRRRSNR